MNSCETNFRANRVKAQCETCPLNRIEAGVVVRIKKLQSLRHHFDGLSNLRRRLACQLVPIPFDTCCTSSQFSGGKRSPSTRVILSGIWHSSCLTWRAMLRTKYHQPRNRNAWLIARKAFDGAYAR